MFFEVFCHFYHNINGTKYSRMDQVKLKPLKYFLVSNSAIESIESMRNIFFTKIPFSTSSYLTSEMLNVFLHDAQYN